MGVLKLGPTEGVRLRLACKGKSRNCVWGKASTLGWKDLESAGEGCSGRQTCTSHPVIYISILVISFECHRLI